MLRTGIDATAAMIARFLVGGYFVISGIGNFLNFATQVERVTDFGFTAAPIAVFAGALLKVIAGVFIMARYHTKIASFFLICYISFATLLFYNPFWWSKYTDTESVFYRNLAILGGLLFLYAHSRGIKLIRNLPEEERLATRGHQPDTYHHQKPENRL